MYIYMCVCLFIYLNTHINIYIYIKYAKILQESCLTSYRSFSPPCHLHPALPASIEAGEFDVVLRHCTQGGHHGHLGHCACFKGVRYFKYCLNVLMVGFLIDLLGGNFLVALCPQQAENKSNTNQC